MYVNKEDYICCDKCHRPLQNVNFEARADGYVLCNECKSWEDADNFKSLIHTIRVETLKEINRKAVALMKENYGCMTYADALNEVMLEMLKKEGLWDETYSS